ncbi:MAG TPA: hypothetical protein VMQ65_04985 [Candidatus Limnocylindria bacterium]|nr:hypothetical protein [Candidatus Limnocylindria bacterium]
MPCSGGQPTRPTRLAGQALAIVAITVLLGAAPAGPTAVAPILLIDAPTQGAGGAGGLFGDLGWILIVGLAIAAVALILAAIVLFRTRGSKAAPPSEGWWTCGKCGAGNMDGSARCHACATWRSTTPRPTPTT